MRRTGETNEFPGRRISKDESAVATEPSMTSDSEEWDWMVDEDPAFYLTKPGTVEGA